MVWAQAGGRPSIPLQTRSVSSPKVATHVVETVFELRRHLEETERNILQLRRSRTQALRRLEKERQLRVKAETDLQALQLQLDQLRDGIPTLEPEVEAGVIALRYSTGWSEAYIHYNTDSKGWTKSPGAPMLKDGNEFVIEIPGQSVEFVLTNGKGEWDKPFSTNGKSNNYKIAECGQYFLQSGKIHNK